MIKQILLDKSTLAAETTTSFLSLVSIFFGGFTAFVFVHPWGIELSILPMIALALASIFTISLDIWFRFKHIFPKGVKTSKVRQIRYLIYGIAMLTCLAQSGAISILIIDDLEKINGSSLPSYTDEYRFIALVVYDIIVPTLYVCFSKKIVKEIENVNRLRWILVN